MRLRNSIFKRNIQSRLQTTGQLSRPASDVQQPLSMSAELHIDATKVGAESADLVLADPFSQRLGDDDAAVSLLVVFQ